MVKYKQQVVDMLSAHESLFVEFKKIHDQYVREPKKWQEQFNEIGMQITPIIRKWENSLCARSESGKYGNFSSKLADKFREEIKIHFPKIDYIGMKIRD